MYVDRPLAAVRVAPRRLAAAREDAGAAKEEQEEARRTPGRTPRGRGRSARHLRRTSIDASGSPRTAASDRDHEPTFSSSVHRGQRRPRWIMAAPSSAGPAVALSAATTARRAPQRRQPYPPRLRSSPSARRRFISPGICPHDTSRPPLLPARAWAAPWKQRERFCWLRERARISSRADPRGCAASRQTPAAALAVSGTAREQRDSGQGGTPNVKVLTGAPVERAHPGNLAREGRRSPPRLATPGSSC